MTPRCCSMEQIGGLYYNLDSKLAAPMVSQSFD